MQLEAATIYNLALESRLQQCCNIIQGIPIEWARKRRCRSASSKHPSLHYRSRRLHNGWRFAIKSNVPASPPSSRPQGYLRLLDILTSRLILIVFDSRPGTSVRYIYVFAPSRWLTGLPRSSQAIYSLPPASAAGLSPPTSPRSY